MNLNKKQYKMCTSFNDGNGVLGYICKVGHRQCKLKQYKNKSVHFADPVTNAVIYCSYLIATIEKYVKE